MKNTQSSLVKIAVAALFLSSLGACTSIQNGWTNMTRGTPSVEFVEPKDGAVITGPVKVKFAVKGMDLKPAGEEIENKRAGHHHVLINSAPLKEGESIGFTDQYLHFGKAQTEAEIKLAPGRYRLTMQFGNGAHQSYGESMSHTINIVVR